jgi:hypothetical protein
VRPERESWLPRLLATVEGTAMSHLECLGAVPASKATRSLEQQAEKIAFLKQLGADRLTLPDLPLAGLEHFARRMMTRKPAALRRLKEPCRTIELTCFLRRTLLRLTDASLTLLDHQIAALWRDARERAEESRASRLRRFRQLLGDLASLAADEALGATDLRAQLHGLITPFEPEHRTTQVAAIRQELARQSQDLARLLAAARTMPLAVPADHALATALATLDTPSATTLPAGSAQPVGPSWRALIDQPDRVAALGCFRAATVMALKRALRNRSVSVEHSLAYRAPEDKLIPAKLWQRDRARFLRPPSAGQRRDLDGVGPQRATRTAPGKRAASRTRTGASVASCRARARPRCSRKLASAGSPTGSTTRRAVASDTAPRARSSSSTWRP